MLVAVISRLMSRRKCSEEQSDGSKYRLETVKGVLDVVKDEYKAEDERNKHIEDKSKSLITLAGVLISLCLVLIKTTQENHWFDVVVLILLLVIILLVMSIWKLLRVLKVTEFKRVNFQGMTTDAVLTSESPEILARIVATYKDAIEANQKITDKKLAPYNSSITAVEVSIVLMLLSVIILALDNTDIGRLRRTSTTPLNGCGTTQCHIVQFISKTPTEAQRWQMTSGKHPTPLKQVRGRRVSD